MSVKLLTEHYLEFLSLRGGCTGPSESTLVKISHCWKSHVVAHYSSLPVVAAAVHSIAVNMLLLVQCLLLLPLCERALCFVLLLLYSSLCPF